MSKWNFFSFDRINFWSIFFLFQVGKKWKKNFLTFFFFFFFFQTNLLSFDFLLTDPASFPTVTIRDAAVARLLRRKPVLHTPGRKPNTPPAASEDDHPVPPLPSGPEDSLSLVSSPDSVFPPETAAPCQKKARKLSQSCEPLPDEPVVSAAASGAVQSFLRTYGEKKRSRGAPLTVGATDESPGPAPKASLKRKQGPSEDEPVTADVPPQPSPPTSAMATTMTSPSPEKTPAELLREVQEIVQDFGRRQFVFFSRFTEPHVRAQLAKASPPPLIPNTPGLTDVFSLGAASAPPPSSRASDLAATPPTCYTRVMSPVLTGGGGEQPSWSNPPVPATSPDSPAATVSPPVVIPAPTRKKRGPSKAKPIIISVAGIPVVSNDGPQPAVKRRRRREVKPGRPVVKGEISSPTWYDLYLSDHTYAKDPRLDPDCVVPREASETRVRKTRRKGAPSSTVESNGPTRASHPVLASALLESSPTSPGSPKPVSAGSGRDSALALLATTLASSSTTTPPRPVEPGMIAARVNSG